VFEVQDFDAACARTSDSGIGLLGGLHGQVVCLIDIDGLS
jgi:hypothetical protein